MVEFLHSVRALFEATNSGELDSSRPYCNEVIEELLSDYYKDELFDNELDRAIRFAMYTKKEL